MDSEFDENFDEGGETMTVDVLSKYVKDNEDIIHHAKMMGLNEYEVEALCYFMSVPDFPKLRALSGKTYQGKIVPAKNAFLVLKKFSNWEYRGEIVDFFITESDLAYADPETLKNMTVFSDGKLYAKIGRGDAEASKCVEWMGGIHVPAIQYSSENNLVTKVWCDLGEGYHLEPMPALSRLRHDDLVEQVGFGKKLRTKFYVTFDLSEFCDTSLNCMLSISNFVLSSDRSGCALLLDGSYQLIPKRYVVPLVAMNGQAMTIDGHEVCPTDAEGVVLVDVDTEEDIMDEVYLSEYTSYQLNSAAYYFSNNNIDPIAEVQGLCNWALVKPERVDLIKRVVACLPHRWFFESILAPEIMNSTYKAVSVDHFFKLKNRYVVSDFVEACKTNRVASVVTTVAHSLRFHGGNAHAIHEAFEDPVDFDFEGISTRGVPVSYLMSWIKQRGRPYSHHIVRSWLSSEIVIVRGRMFGGLSPMATMGKVKPLHYECYGKVEYAFYGYNSNLKYFFVREDERRRWSEIVKKVFKTGQGFRFSVKVAYRDKTACDSCSTFMVCSCFLLVNVRRGDDGFSMTVRPNQLNKVVNLINDKWSLRNGEISECL